MVFDHRTCTWSPRRYGAGDHADEISGEKNSPFLSRRTTVNKICQQIERFGKLNGHIFASAFTVAITSVIALIVSVLIGSIIDEFTWSYGFSSTLLSGVALIAAGGIFLSVGVIGLNGTFAAVENLAWLYKQTETGHFWSYDATARRAPGTMKVIVITQTVSALTFGSALLAIVATFVGGFVNGSIQTWYGYTYSNTFNQIVNIEILVAGGALVATLLTFIALRVTKMVCGG